MLFRKVVELQKRAGIPLLLSFLQRRLSTSTTLLSSFPMVLVGVFVFLERSHFVYSLTGLIGKDDNSFVPPQPQICLGQGLWIWGIQRLQTKQDRKKAVEGLVRMVREAEQHNPFVQLVATLELGSKAMKEKDRQAGLAAMAAFLIQFRQIFGDSEAYQQMLPIIVEVKEAFDAEDYEAVIPPLFAPLIKMRLTRDEYWEDMINGLAEEMNK
jgi:hypothetical protein